MNLQKCFIFKIGKVSGEMDPPMFDVTGLEEGQEYLFRVTAVNDEGESEPLTADAAIKAKNPFGNSPNLIYFSKSQSNLKIAFSLFVSFFAIARALARLDRTFSRNFQTCQHFCDSLYFLSFSFGFCMIE